MNGSTRKSYWLFLSLSMNANNIPEAHSLTIEYALRRSEIFQSYWRSIARSPKFRNTILLYSIAIGLITLLIRVLFSEPLRAGDVVGAALWAVGFFLFIPFWMFIRGKTAKRTLTVSLDGIATEIGRIKAQIPWSKVRMITETPQFILIAHTKGNAFFVPNRAFSEPSQKVEFLDAVRQWVSRN
jgi:YcxB-like protein